MKERREEGKETVKQYPLAVYIDDSEMLTVGYKNAF